MTIKIYSYPNNNRVQRCLIAAKYVDVAVEEVPVSLPLADGGKGSSTFAKVPYLELENGDSLCESNAMLYYIGGLRADMDLLGRSHLDKANVLKWLSYVEDSLQGSFAPLLFPALFPNFYKVNVPEEKAAEARLAKSLGLLNDYLKTTTYLVGERLTIADMALIPCMKVLLTTVINEAQASQIPHVMRYFNTCVNKSNFAEILGEVTVCTQTIREKREEEAKSKKAAAKKAAPAPAAAPAAEAPAAEKPAAKPKHPLDLLPAAKMNGDEWKRQYSNNDTREVALPWLWENVVQGEWTFYFCKYKYNDELSKTFMAANLITGWFQRIEHVRKFLFGNVMVFGKSGEKVEISGVWMVRGEMDPLDDQLMGKDDAAYYDWRKMDIGDAADKTLVEDYFAWDGAFKGGSELEFNQGKTFK